MYLLLGRLDDSCCAGVLARLLEQGLPVRLVADPLAPPARLAWRLDDTGLDSRLALDGRSPESISGVLVRDVGWLDPAGWEPDDHAYMQTESRAALLAWLTGLPCPVINRASAALWYRSRLPLLAWRPLLHRAGLPTPEILLTNDPDETLNFVQRLEAEGVGGAVCTTLTADGTWLVTPSHATGLGALQKLAPVCLVEPHGPTRSACVVGDRIVWDGTPSSEYAALEPHFLRLAEIAGLAFLEVAAAPVRRGPAVVLVDPLVRLEHFRTPARERILDALLSLLTGEALRVPQAREALA